MLFIPPPPSPPAKLKICASPPLSSFDFFHLNPTQRVGEDGNRAHTPLYPILLFFFFEKCVIYELNVNEMSAILFYKRNKPTLLYVLFFTKIACCISQKVNEMNSNMFLWT